MRQVLPALCAGLLACSAVTAAYVRPGYEPAAAGAVKRVAVLGWAPAGQDELAALAARIAADRLHLRTNYIVAAAPPARAWNAACDGREGVILVEVLDRVDLEASVALALSAELRRCSDGALLWRAQGQRATNPHDEDLQHLAAAYVRTGSLTAGRLAAPLFALLQDLLDGIPNPALTDEELLEKIDTE